MKLRKDWIDPARRALLVAAAGLCVTVFAPTASAAPVPESDIGVLFNCGTYPANQPTSRSQTLTRSKTWLDARVPYSQSACHSNHYGSYRTDCSGFVSMAWGLRVSYTTSDVHLVSHEIPRADLRPGDALNDAGSHMALFLRWDDAARTRPVVREQAGPKGSPTVERVWSASYASGYTPIRYDKIVEDAAQPASGPMFHQVRGVDGGEWSGFQPLAGYGTAEPGDARDMSIAAMPDGSAQVLIVGADGRVYHQVREVNGTWTGFQPLAGMGTADPAGGSRVSIAGMPDGSAQVLIVGADGKAYHQVRDVGGSWTGFRPVAGMGSADPAGAKDVAITGMPDGSAQVLIIGADSRVYHQIRGVTGNWSGFQPLAGMGTADPAGGSRVSIAGMPDGSAQVLIVGADGKVYHQMREVNGGWTGFQPVAGVGTSDPAGGKDVAITGMPGGSAQVLIIGADDRVYHQVRETNGSWTGFQPLAGMGTADPAAGSQVSIAGMPDNSAQVTIVGRR
ncbi:hypothetical protein KIPE111705_04730 [Kibdelosporangium persicum]|uniref:PLL-like beta propeller domain-containing protein n=1 Tax=Kibdelosporangium persicum TaxID=2698649 RepID=A0ABX2F674_9PSEU|nr:hypothetical protein [Kibdelosporangium persicum]NRN66436.1 hypothetical protein [Kibdelosporangium persicum]